MRRRFRIHGPITCSVALADKVLGVRQSKKNAELGRRWAKHIDQYNGKTSFAFQKCQIANKSTKFCFDNSIKACECLAYAIITPKKPSSRTVLLTFMVFLCFSFESCRCVLLCRFHLEALYWLGKDRVNEAFSRSGLITHNSNTDKLKPPKT